MRLEFTWSIYMLIYGRNAHRRISSLFFHLCLGHDLISFLSFTGLTLFWAASSTAKTIPRVQNIWIKSSSTTLTMDLSSNYFFPEITKRFLRLTCKISTRCFGVRCFSTVLLRILVFTAFKHLFMILHCTNSNTNAGPYIHQVLVWKFERQQWQRVALRLSRAELHCTWSTTLILSSSPYIAWAQNLNSF